MFEPLRDDKADNAYVSLRILVGLYGVAYILSFFYSSNPGIFGAGDWILILTGLAFIHLCVHPASADKSWYSSLVVALSFSRACGWALAGYYRWTDEVEGPWRTAVLATFIWLIATVAVVGWVVTVSEREELKRHGLDPGQ